MRDGPIANAGLLQIPISSGSTSSLMEPPVHYAAGNGHVQIVRKLIDLGFDPWNPVWPAPDPEFTALDRAILGGHLDVVNMLLQGLRTSASEDTPAGPDQLQLAVCSGKIALVQRILDLSVDVNAVSTKYGTTALYAAAGQGKPDVCRVLLEAGANPDIAAPGGYLPLHMAAWCGHLPVVELVLEIPGPQSVPRTLRGLTPVMLAAMQKHHHVVKRLLQIDAHAAVDREHRLRYLQLPIIQEMFLLQSPPVGTWE